MRASATKAMAFFLKITGNQKGFGLIVAIFIIVILGMFGTLIAKFTIMGSTESAEEYLWAQALYSAESAVQLRILTHDGGHGWDGSANSLTIEKFKMTAPKDTFTNPNISATLVVQATRVNVSRRIEEKFLLSSP
ncbi:hypothetical protein MNBD_DELTA03-1703 [hydrothermal vent metagenome]|uniref:Type 4 fimbrial biogenesis protein PilX N-terminal domain-containing protein n=1 Tax=hydrothermal vent metagenome TaxID=652676 RepID=A0A3B0W5A7_9ZZZZ